MTSDDWMTAEIARLTAEHGAVPPPWSAFPDTHPYQICWRMGAGEAYAMVWSRWWEDQNLDEAARISYFHRWPPPPRWLDWMIDAIWSPGEDEEQRSPFFARAESLGFPTRACYESDLADPRWLN